MRGGPGGFGMRRALLVFGYAFQACLGLAVIGLAAVAGVAVDGASRSVLQARADAPTPVAPAPAARPSVRPTFPA